MRTLKNKKGMAYVLTCVIILISMMLISVLFQYRYVYSAIEEQQEEAQMQLDSVILKSAMENYDALKRGSAYQEYINYTQLEQDAYVALGFFNEDIESIEKHIYTINRPTITPIAEGGFGLTVTYELQIAFWVLGEDYGTITVPVSLTSKYTEK